MNYAERLSNLEEQVKGQERRLRYYRLSMVLMALVWSGIVLVGATTDKIARYDEIVANKIYAHRIHVVDEEKNTKVFLDAEEDRGHLTVYNNKGEPALSLTSQETGGFFSIFNIFGAAVVKAYVDTTKLGVVGTYNFKGEGPMLQARP